MTYTFKIPCTVYQGTKLLGDEVLSVEVQAEDLGQAQKALERVLEDAVRREISR